MLVFCESKKRLRLYKYHQALKDFLQNIVTNDINKVSDTFSCFASLLTPQGKYLFDFFESILSKFFIADFNADMDLAAEILSKDYSSRFRVEPEKRQGRCILDERRSLGSVIKLLTQNHDYTDEYNELIRGISMHIKDRFLRSNAFTSRPGKGIGVNFSQLIL
mgnify:CR=1 FL=1